MFEQRANQRLTRSPVHMTALFGALVLFLALMWIAGRAGLASLLTAYAGKANVARAADAAVTVSPGDPDAHLVRGELLETNGDLPSAINEYETAASLRPDDYVLWLSVARALELNGERERAIAAAR